MSATCRLLGPMPSGGPGSEALWLWWAVISTRIIWFLPSEVSHLRDRGDGWVLPHFQQLPRGPLHWGSFSVPVEPPGCLGPDNEKEIQLFPPL